MQGRARGRPGDGALAGVVQDKEVSATREQRASFPPPGRTRSEGCDSTALLIPVCWFVPTERSAGPETPRPAVAVARCCLWMGFPDEPLTQAPFCGGARRSTAARARGRRGPDTARRFPASCASCSCTPRRHRSPGTKLPLPARLPAAHRRAHSAHRPQSGRSRPGGWCSPRCHGPATTRVLSAQRRSAAAPAAGVRDDRCGGRWEAAGTRHFGRAPGWGHREPPHGRGRCGAGRPVAASTCPCVASRDAPALGATGGGGNALPRQRPTQLSSNHCACCFGPSSGSPITGELPRPPCARLGMRGWLRWLSGGASRMRGQPALAAGFAPGGALATPGGQRRPRGRPHRARGRAPPGEGGVPLLSLVRGARPAPLRAEAPPEGIGGTRLLRALRVRRARPIGWARPGLRTAASRRREPGPGPGLTGLAANRSGRAGTDRGFRPGIEVVAKGPGRGAERRGRRARAAP